MRHGKFILFSLTGLAVVSLGDESIRRNLFDWAELAAERVGGASGARAAALKALSAAEATLLSPAYPLADALRADETTPTAAAPRRCTPRRRAVAALAKAVEGVEPLETLVLTAAPLVEDGLTRPDPDGTLPQPEPPPPSPPPRDVLPPPILPVPEPSLWAVMIAGFGLVGAALRRKSRRRRSV